MTDQEIIARYPISNPQTPKKLFSVLFKGCRRADGTYYWTRWQYFVWVWKAFWKKWLKASIRCKLGRHRVGYRSDTGIGGCCQKKGCMDVWCLDCDRALEVPIDDATNFRGTSVIMDIWKGRHNIAGNEE